MRRCWNDRAQQVPQVTCRIAKNACRSCICLSGLRRNGRKSATADRQGRKRALRPLRRAAPRSPSHLRIPLPAHPIF